MITILLYLGWGLLILATLCFCLFVFFITVKLGAYAFYCGKARFEFEQQKRSCLDGNKTPKGKPRAS